MLLSGAHDSMSVRQTGVIQTFIVGLDFHGNFEHAPGALHLAIFFCSFTYTYPELYLGFFLDPR